MSVNNISKRLAAIGALVTEGGTLADIGTDHALLPIRLVLDGKVPRAIAMDVNEGPLARAGEAIRRAGLEDRIQMRLSDGFAALKKGEADSAVIAGMGGDLVIRILTDGMEVASSMREIICSPQSEIARVRAFAREHGFVIDAEDMVLEDGKYYQMFRLRKCGNETIKGINEEAGRGPGEPCRSGQAGPEALDLWDHYGKELIENAHPVLQSYLQWERNVREQVLGQLMNSLQSGPENKDHQRTAARIDEVRRDLSRNAAAMEMMKAQAQKKQDC